METDQHAKVRQAVDLPEPRVRSLSLEAASYMHPYIRAWLNLNEREDGGLAMTFPDAGVSAGYASMCAVNSMDTVTVSM